ncbi:MAG TPA: hypothetical protein VK988_18365 [Acidimicrobiales bacterium]|nr:hypothetical protein [Acidimicrobiales bacterium]
MAPSSSEKSPGGLRSIGRGLRQQMIVQAIIGALGGLVILIGGLVLLDIRPISFGLVLLLPSLYVIYWFLKKV